jgi:hypothetical protein
MWKTLDWGKSMSSAGGILLGRGGFLDQLSAGTAANRPALIAEVFLLMQPEYGLAGAVLSGCLDLVQKQKLTVDELAPYVPAIMTAWNSEYEALSQRQQQGPSTPQMSEDDYIESRHVAEVALDLFGYLPYGIVSEALHNALSLPDLRLKVFAAVSLLRQHQAVDAVEIERIASSNQVRIILWRMLKTLRLETMMPPCWSEPEQLAASSFIDWASHFLETGEPPQEIQLMGVFPTSGDEGILDAYLFRFRECPKPSKPDEGWMAAVAGPFYRGEELNSPWSACDPWDSMSPDEHFAKLYFR